MSLRPVNVFENTSYVEFLGKKYQSNTTQTFGANPPDLKKTVDIIYVEGNEATLSYVVILRNRAGFAVKFPFIDPIQDGGQYVDGSFKVDGEKVDPTVDAEEIFYDGLTALEPGRAHRIEFQVKVQFNMFEGQEPETP